MPPPKMAAACLPSPRRASSARTAPCAANSWWAPASVRWPVARASDSGAELGTAVHLYPGSKRIVFGVREDRNRMNAKPLRSWGFCYPASSPRPDRGPASESPGRRDVPRRDRRVRRRRAGQRTASAAARIGRTRCSGRLAADGRWSTAEGRQTLWDTGKTRACGTFSLTPRPGASPPSTFLD